MERIVAIMPIKLQNERLPGKNTKKLGDKPLLQYAPDNTYREAIDINNPEDFIHAERLLDMLM